MINYLNPIECKVDAKTATLIRPILSYTSVFYQQTAFRKIRKEYQKSSLTKDDSGSYYFLTGLLPRVIAHLKKISPLPTLSVESLGISAPIQHHKYKVKNLVLREDQEKLIQQACVAQRGIIQAPTGSGKTIIGIALYSCFDNCKLLWLCHTKDLMIQTANEFKKFGFTSIGLVGDGKLELNKQITIATRQTFKKVNQDDYDMFIVDEAHHCNSFKSDYFDILTKLPAPLRFGLTATPIDTEEGKLASEGLIGPLVASLSVQEGNDLGIIAKPVISLLRVPKNHSVNELRQYQDVYAEGVVHSSVRNNLIIDKALEHVNKGDSVLILVNHIEHGNNLLEIGREKNLPILFVQGSTGNDVRVETKEALDAKHIKCVISTVIWYEGISIRSLNVIINAAGGKSEIRTLQTIGRGLRVTKDKKDVIIYDLWDVSHRFLIEHSGERICTYMDQGWM